MSFCASRNDLQVRFFCIMSWSRPVITTTMKMPLRNCFQKYWRDMGSSNTKMRLRGSSATAFTASVGDHPNMLTTWKMMNINAANMHSVCRVSVHTSVLMPLRRV